MWIAASVPFWIVGIAATVIGACAIVYGFVCVTPETPEKQREFNITVFAAFLVVVLGGMFLVLAAKIAS